MSSSAILPQQLPVMPLPGAVLFPHALLTLYIFEPRYRQMLQHALQQHRRRLPGKVGRYLAELRDLEMLADLMASTFVNDPLRRQRVLEERSLNQRLRFLIRYLRDEIGNAAA